MTATVAELIERLQDMPPDARVLLATQPSWPLQFEVSGVVGPADLADEQQCEAHSFYGCLECAAAQPPTVYIVEGGHPSDDRPYAPRAAFQAWGGLQ